MFREASCHCRTLRLGCEGEPVKVSLCNCFDCQRRTGSLFSVAAFFPREAVRLLEGQARHFRRPSASGHPVTFHFCMDCGSTLWWEPDRMPHLAGVAAGSFADAAFAAPTQAVWTSDKHHWLTFPDTIVQHERNPPPRSLPDTVAVPAAMRSGSRASSKNVRVRPYEPGDFASVDTLWQQCFPDAPSWNRADRAIPAKMHFQPDLFFVAESDAAVIGTAMAGYDGHRGWLYSLAVSPSYWRSGIGTALLEEAESALQGLGCLKINLQIRQGNEQVAAFYQRHGYTAEARTSMAKRLGTS